MGRFLEHARVYYFQNGGEEEYYIGSADMMQRNLNNRVEALVPVIDPNLKVRLEEVLEVELADDVLAWEGNPDGSWTKVASHHGVDTHQQLLDLASRQETKDALRQATESAVARGVFGAPTFFIGDEMHFGQDRLDFVEEAL